MCMYSIYNSICRAGLESESAGSAAFGRWSQSAVDAQLQSAGVSLALGAVPPKSRLASRLQHGKVGARRAVSTVPLVEGPVAALQQVHLRVAERRVAIGVASAITLPQITRPSTKTHQQVAAPLTASGRIANKVEDIDRNKIRPCPTMTPSAPFSQEIRAPT